jgi:chromosome segregation ATPase
LLTKLATIKIPNYPKTFYYGLCSTVQKNQVASLMGRLGITFNDVKEAIAALQEQQKNPTVDHIREILGTGSKSTIARFLREWRAQYGLHRDDGNQLPSDLLGTVNGLWDALRSKADSQINEYRQAFDAKIGPLQQQLAQARQLETGLRQNLHTVEEELQQQKKETQQCNAKLLTQTQEKISLTARIAALEARRQEHQTENQQLHQLLKQVQENLEHYQASTQQLRQEQSLLLEKQQNDYEQKLSLLLMQANAAFQEKSICQAQYDQLTQVYGSLTVEHKILTTHQAEIKNQHESLERMYHLLHHDWERLKSQNQVQTAELITLQRTSTERALKIKLKDEQMALQQDALTKANDKIEILRHENQLAQQEKSLLEGQLRQMQAILPFYKDKALIDCE